MRKIKCILLITCFFLSITGIAGKSKREGSSTRLLSEINPSSNYANVVQKNSNNKVEAVPEISFSFGDAMKQSWGRGWLDIYYSLNYDPKAPFKESDWICISDEIGNGALGLHDPANGGGAGNTGSTGWKTLTKLAGKRVTFAFKGYAIGKQNVSATWLKFQLRANNPKTQQTIDLPEIIEPAKIIDMSENSSYTWQKINNCWRYTNKVINKQSGKNEFSWCILPTISFNEVSFPDTK